MVSLLNTSRKADAFSFRHQVLQVLEGPQVFSGISPLQSIPYLEHL